MQRSICLFRKEFSANLYILFLFKKNYTFCFCCLREYSKFFPNSPVFSTSINQLSHIYHLIINRELASDEILIIIWLWVRKLLESVVYFYLYIYLKLSLRSTYTQFKRYCTPEKGFQLKHLQKICTLKPEIIFGN